MARLQLEPLESFETTGELYATAERIFQLADSNSETLIKRGLKKEIVRFAGSISIAKQSIQASQDTDEQTDYAIIDTQADAIVGVATIKEDDRPLTNRIPGIIAPRMPSWLLKEQTATYSKKVPAQKVTAWTDSNGNGALLVTALQATVNMLGASGNRLGWTYEPTGSGDGHHRAIREAGFDCFKIGHAYNPEFRNRLPRGVFYVQTRSCTQPTADPQLFLAHMNKRHHGSADHQTSPSATNTNHASTLE